MNPSSYSIRILTNGVNSPGDNNQVSVLYGMEMTKTVLCLTIFLSGRKHKPIDFSLSDRKLYSKSISIEKDFKSFKSYRFT